MSNSGNRPNGSRPSGKPGGSPPSGKPDRSGGPPRRVDTDERPFVLIRELTQACDLTCEHCRADAQPDRHPDELATEEAERLLDETREFGENQLVVFSGGDPLKRDDAVDFVEYGTGIGLNVTGRGLGPNHRLGL